MGFTASRGRGIGWEVLQSLKSILQNALLLLRVRFGSRAVNQPATESTADSPRPDGEEPVTALPLFDGAMILYAYASGRLVGVESSNRTVLLKQQLPAEIFSHCSLTEIPCLKCNAGLESLVALFKANHLVTFQPALLTDTAADWPALRKWDFDFFAQSCGHIEVEVALQGGRKRRHLLKDYLALLRRGEPTDFGGPCALPYLRGWFYERDAPWLSNDLWRHGDFHDVAFQDYFRKLPQRHHPDFHWLFIGGEGSTTPLHVDPSGTHAWLTQIRGRKRFTLFAPFKMASLLKHGGGFKPLKQILQERSALPLRVILNPGDTIFVPAHWPHEVECIDDSISVTWNFLGESVFPIIRTAFLANATRSREPAEGQSLTTFAEET